MVGPAAGIFGGIGLPTVVGSAIGGVLLAGVVSFSTVSLQTGKPSANPADKPILVYGQK